MRNFTKRALLLVLLVLCLFGISVLAAGAEANGYDTDAAAIEAGAVVRIGATEGQNASYYTTVAEAIGAAEDGDTVYVLANTTFATECTMADKAVTIKGATSGLTMTVSSKLNLGANADLAIEDLTLALTIAGKTGFVNVSSENVSFAMNNVTASATNESYIVYGLKGAKFVAFDVTNSTINANAVIAKVQDGATICSAEAPATLTDVTSNYMDFYVYTATVYVDIYGGSYTKYFAYGGDSTAGTFVCRVNPTGDKTTTFNVMYVYQHGPSSSQSAKANLYFRNASITQIEDSSKRPLFNNKVATCNYTIEFAENVTSSTLYGYFNTTIGSTLAFKLNADIAGVSAGFKAKVTPASGTSVAYYTNVTTAIANAADGATVTLLANAAINTSSIKDRAITIVGAEKYTLSATSQSSHIFNLTGETASLTLENLVVDVSNTGKNTNAYMFGTDGTTTGTYTITLTNVDTKWLAGSGAIYGYASTKATITLTDCSFEGGAAIINTKSANAANVTMYLDNVTCVGDVVQVNSNAADRVTVVTNSTALNFASDADAIAAGVFFRFAATEGGKVYAATLADAVNEAADGATVYVLANATVDAGVSLAAKAVTVTSAGSAAVTLTNASSGYLFSVSNGATLTLANINVATNGALVTAGGATSAVILDNGATVTGAASSTPFVSITSDFGKFEMKAGSKLEVTSASSAIALVTISSGVTSELTFNGTVKIGTADAPIAISAATVLISAPRLVKANFGGSFDFYVSGNSGTLIATGRTTADGATTALNFTGTMNCFVTGYTGTSAMSSLVKDNTNNYGITATFDGATLNQSHVGSASGGNAAAYSAVFYMYCATSKVIVKNSTLNIGAAGQGHSFIYVHGNAKNAFTLSMIGNAVINMLCDTGNYANILRDNAAIFTATADATGTPVIKGSASCNMFASSGTTITADGLVIASTKLGGTISSATNVYYATDAIAQSFGYAYRLNEQTLGGTGAYASAMTGYYKTLDEAKALGVNGDTVYDLANNTEIKIEIGNGTSFADDAAAIAGGAFFRVGATEGGAVYFTTLADAIEAAKTGDTIYVIANATVTDSVTVAAKALTITSAGSTAVTLTNGGSGYLFVATGAAELTITNINVATNGAFVDASGLTGTVTVGNGTTVSGAASANAFFKVTSAATGTIALANGSTLKVTSAPAAVTLFKIDANLGKLDVDGNIIVGTASESLTLTAESVLFEVAQAATVAADFDGDIDVYVSSKKITFWRGGASTITITGTFDFHVAGFDGMIQCFKDRAAGDKDKAITVNFTGATVAMTHEISATGNNAAYSGLFYIYVAATKINVTDSNVTIGAAGQGFPFMLASGSNSSLNIVGNSVITINCDQATKSTNRIVAGAVTNVTVSANSNGTPVLVGASNGSLFSGNTNVTLNAAIIARGTTIGGTISSATNLYFATDALAKANGYAYRLNEQTFGGTGAYASAMTGYYKTLDAAKDAGEIGDVITDLATNEEIEIKPVVSTLENDAAAIESGAFFRVGATQGGALGEVYFTSLADAIAAAAAEGDTVYVLANATVADITLTGKSVTIEGVGSVTLNGSGSTTALFTLAADGSTISALTVKNLSVSMGAKNFVLAQDGANTVTLENVNVTADADVYIIHVNASGALTEVAITNGTFVGGYATFVTKGSLADLDITGSTLKCAIYRTEATGGVLGSATDYATLTDVTLTHNNGTASSGFTFRQKTTAYIAVVGGFYNMRPVDYNAEFVTTEAHNGAFFTCRDNSEQYITLTINKGSDKTTQFHTAGRKDATNQLYNSVIALYCSGKVSIDAYNTTFKAYSNRSRFVAFNTSVTTDGLVFTNCTFDTPGSFFQSSTNTSFTVVNSTRVNGTIGSSKVVGDFDSDADAVAFGFTVRLGDTEGGAVYYTDLTAALNAAPMDNGNGGETTVLILANTTHSNVGSDGGAGTYFNAKFRKKVHITSKGTTPFTVTTEGTINFYVSDGCVLRFTNVTFNLANRLARVDGSAEFIFGAGCTMNSSNTIFIYDNGNNLKNDYVEDTNLSYTDDLTYVIDVQEGAVINSTGSIATALFYRGSSTTSANITLKISGEINMTSSKPIFSDNGKAIVTVYYDAFTAKVTNPSSTWFSGVLRSLTEIKAEGAPNILYAKGFKTTAEAAEFANKCGASGMTYSANPEREWNYTMLYYGQFVHQQYNVLDSYGGEIWQIKSMSTIYQTATLKDLGTVTFKSYNGAYIGLQGAIRIRTQSTNLILDGIKIVLNGGASLGIHGGSEEAPSRLQLINGAIVTGPVANAGQMIYFMNENGAAYSHLYVDATSKIVMEAPTADLKNNTHGIWVHGNWANGSIVIEGTITSNATAGGKVNLITIAGAANGCSIVLDGAKLEYTAEQTTKYALDVVANTFNGCIEIKNTTVADSLINGIVATDSLGRKFGSITGAINFAPTGTPVTITLLQAATFASGITIENKFVTIVGLGTTLGGTSYDLKYTGTGGYAFTMVNLGSLTFQNINFNAGRPLLLYKSAANADYLEDIDAADLDITLSLISTYIKVNGSSRFISSSNSDVACDTFTLNVDANSTMDYTVNSSDRRSMFEFSNASHKYIVMNINGALKFTDHYEGTNTSYFIYIKGPSAFDLTLSETASVQIDISDVQSNDNFIYLKSGKNTLTIHENAIKAGIGGLELFRQEEAAVAPALTIIAANANSQAALLALTAEDAEGNTFAPISWLTVKEGVYYYGTLAGVLDAAEDKGTVALLQNTTVFNSALLSGKSVTITAVEGAVVTNATTTYFVVMGNNSELNVTNFKYQGNAFVQFANPNGTATLNLNDGAIIEGGDPTAAAIIGNSADAKGAITINIGAKAELYRPASYTLSGLVSASHNIFYFRADAAATSANVTLNVYGKLANLTTVADDAHMADDKTGANAGILYNNLANSTIIVNIYETAVVEGTCNNNQYDGNYSGMFYFATFGTNAAYLNIYGGEITSHGRNPLAYLCAATSNVKIQGAPKITMTDLAYGLVWFANSTNTSLAIGAEEGAAININGQPFYAASPAKAPVIFAASGMDDDEAIEKGMFFRMDGVYYGELAHAIALIPDGGEGTIYVLSTAAISGPVQITNKNVTIVGANNENYDLKFTGSANSVFFKISTKGSLTLKNLNIYTVAQLVNYDANVAIETETANKNITVDIIACEIVAEISARYSGSAASVATLIGSSNHYMTGNGGCGEAGNAFVLNIDKDTTIDFTSTYDGACYFISLNHNNHPYVTTNISGTIVVKVPNTGAESAFFICSNNPSHTTVNVTEDAQITMTVAEERLSKTALVYFTGGTINSNKLTIHINAITDENGASTLPAAPLYKAYSASSIASLTIVADNADLQAAILALQMHYNVKDTTPVAYNPVLFNTIVDGKYYYGTLDAMINLVEDEGTINLVASGNMIWAATLNGKTVTITAASDDLVLTTSAAITLKNDATLILKDIAINSTAYLITPSVATTTNTLKMDGVTLTASAIVVHGSNKDNPPKIAIEILNSDLTAASNFVYLGTSATLTAMTVTDTKIAAEGLVKVNATDAVAKDVVLTDVTMTSGVVFYAYYGTIYADIFGGTYAATLVYGGDGATNTIGVRVNPTGDKTTTFTRATSSNSVYNAWVHLNPTDIKEVSFTLRNLTVTDTGAAPLFAIRAKATLSISVENCTFDVTGALLSSMPAACGVTFNTDATARMFGYGSRIGNEGGTYFQRVSDAANAAPAGDVTTTIYVIANTTAINIGADNPSHFAKKIIITSAPGEGAPYTVTVNSSILIAFYVGTGAEVTLTNIIYNVPQRFGRFDGSAVFTFGEGCVVNQSNAIFFYDNGNCKNPDGSFMTDTAYTVDIQKGATINCGTAFSYGLHYKSDKDAPATVTVKIAGTINMTGASYLVSDPGKVSNFIVYYDASTAKVTSGQDLWFNSNIFRNALTNSANGDTAAANILYAKGFESSAAAAEWGYTHVGASAMTVSANPDREWNYTFIQSAQTKHEQYLVLDTYGGEYWMLKTNTSGFYQTHHFTNLGTVVVKSYNGAQLKFQDNNPRLRIRGTILVLDGIEVISNGGAFMLYESTKEAPSGLKMINGAKITATASNTNTPTEAGGSTGVSSPVMIMTVSGADYAFIEIDATSSITHTGTTTQNAYIIYSYNAWTNGYINVKGTLTTSVSGKNVAVISLNGAGLNTLTLDGATLTNSGTATEKATIVTIESGCALAYESINNTVMNLTNATGASKMDVAVEGAISFKGLTDEEAALKAIDLGMTVRCGNVYSQVLSTGIINAIPVGGKGEVYIMAPSKVPASVTIKNRDVTIIGTKSAQYDLTYTSSSNYMFYVDSVGTVTFKDLTITGGRPLLQYYASEYTDVAQADKDIVINFVNTTVDITGSSVLINSQAHHGNVASKKCDSVTVNIDKDSVINYTATSTGEIYCISFNHNTHPYVALNVYGTLNFTAAAASNTYIYLVRSNNPSSTKILFAEGAHVKATINSTVSGGAYVTSCTGGNATSNTLTMYLDAITENGQLTIGDMKLYSGYTSACVFNVMVVAKDNSLANTLMNWAAANSNTGGTGGAYDEYPLSASLELNGVYYFSNLGGVVAQLPEGGEATITLSTNMTSTGTINLVNKTLTIIGVGATKPTLTLTGSPAFQLGDNSHLILSNLDIIAKGSFILTNGTSTTATTKVDIINGTTIDIRAYTGYYFLRTNSVGVLTMNIAEGTSVKLLTDGTAYSANPQGMFDFTTYSNKVAEGSVIYVDGQVIYGLKFSGTTAGTNRSAMFKIGDNTIDVIFSKTADVQLLHQNAIGGTWNAIVCLDSASASTIVTFNGCKITLADQCAIYGLNGTKFSGTYEINDITLMSSGSFLVSDYAATGGVNSTEIKFRNFDLNGNALTQNDKLPYTLLANIGFASEADAFAQAAYFTLTPGTYSNLGGAIEAAEDGAVILVNKDLVLSSATLVGKTLTFKGATAGITITNKSSGYLFTIGSNAHLIFENLTYEGNFFAQFSAAAGTTSSLTLGENAHIIGGDNVADAYILYCSALKGSAEITITKNASIIRPAVTLSGASSPYIYRFGSYGHVVLNVYGQLKNLTKVDAGQNATIGYANIVGVKLNENDPYNTGMILNIYPGAEVEGTCDSAQYNGYYQGEFYFAVNGTNHHELNIYGGSIVSHGINSLAYFGNNQVTVRIEGTPYISMPNAKFSMICLHNTKSAAESQTEFYADVEVGASFNLNGMSFFWASSPEVSMIKAGKFFTDDNAAAYGAGYRVIDDNGISWYVASLGAAATISRNGGTIYLVGDVTDYGASTVLDKYLFLEPVKPGYVITLNGSTLFTISSGTKESPVRMYIRDIVIKGSCSGVLFSLTGNANGIFVLDNCSMNGGAGVIKLSGAATASVTLNKGNYTMKTSPFYGTEYSTLTLNANDITFVATGNSSNANSLFHLTNNATGYFNIKGGSANTAFHTFYTMDTSIVYVNAENFSIVTKQWAFASQSSTTWYANLTNVNAESTGTVATRVYAKAGSYFNIMGGSFVGRYVADYPAVLTFGNSLTVNIFDCYIASDITSCVTGLTNTVNINIYGGTYIYNGTKANFAPIMLNKPCNLTVKGGTFINTSGAGPVFNNTAYSANILTLEAYNAISNSSNLILNFAAEGTPTAALGAYGRLTLNTLMMTRGAAPNTTVGTATSGAMSFKSTLSASAVEYLQSLALGSELKFGMLVIPTELLANGVDFTHAGLANYSSVFGDKYQLGVDYFDYEASFADIEIKDDGCYVIRLTHSGISEEDFNTKYSVVFYTKYEVMAQAGTDANGYPIYAQVGTDANGNPVYNTTVYRYADYEESENARSLAEVAYAAYNNANDTSDKDILSVWCNGETDQKTIDIFLVAGGSNAAGNTPYAAEYAESLIDHQCATCGHIADSALFADAKYTCVNKLVHGKALTLEDGVYTCDCGYTATEVDDPDNAVCPATHTCGAAKATFQNVLKTPITNVFYSGIVSERAPQNFTSSIAYATASKYTAVGSAPTFGLGWSADTIGPEYGMAIELAKNYNTESGKYAAIMKYAFNDATLVTEDAYYGTFADELYNNFMQMVTDQIAVYTDLGYKVNVAGLYWMQGEADTANASAYAEALQKLVANVRADLSQITGDDLTAMPVVVGEIATFTGTAGNADRVALKNAQNSVTGVLIDQTSLYMANNDGIFLDVQNVVDTGARVAATIMAVTDDNVVIPEIANTTEILDSNGNPIPGMEGHTSLAMSLIAAPSGATITLTADQTVYDAMNVTNRDDIVINGSGNTITVVSDAPAIALQNASVTLENIVIEHSGNSAAITLDSASTLVVEEGTEISAERTAIEMTGNASTLVINGGTFETTATDATDADAIIRTTTANITITGGTFVAADGSSIVNIDKNASHKLIVNITGGTFVAEDRVTQKVDADGHFVEGEYDIYESIAFVNNCPTAILVIDPLVLAAHPELSVYNVAAQ